MKKKNTQDHRHTGSGLPQKNDLILLTIGDMSVGGEGIGKYNGMAFFVKDTVIGDRIRARVTKRKKNYGYARLEELLSPSPDRIKPPCPLHRRCGGCQLQTMSYPAQLAYKQNLIRNQLIRLGGFSPETVEQVLLPIVGMEHPYRYRNKAQFPIGADRQGNPVAGFYASRTHDIIPVQDCLLGVDQNRIVLDAVLSYMRDCQIPPYDETTGNGLIRHLLIRYGFSTNELLVCLVINGTDLPEKERLIEALCAIDGMTGISLNINQKKTNVIMGDVTTTIWGKDSVTDRIYLRDCETFERTNTSVRYRISPQSFYQVNPLQTEKLYSLALDYAGLNETQTVWDLYCGIGTISLFLALRAKKVCGVEIVPQAIADARENAAANGMTNTEFFVGKAEEVLPAFYAGSAPSDMRRPDVIVVDPPRKGCDQKCLETMLLMAPERIVYVSCDPATLARDLRFLCDGGYELKKVRGVDQFGQTRHVETVVMLSHKKPTA
ncbi:MAG: 23S rRNA (uracil(1939)-C(5))-methyltransferase RlmD [Roseburia sp.]|jgi:23S rRNA (uracil1939-C5)-methyltransferase|nr:23S rRNA (uracil(1939)-C(5))-methyltransferase RlmD [Roseburia sp.]